MEEITHGQVRTSLEARLASGGISSRGAGLKVFRTVSSPQRKPSTRNMKLSAECVRDKSKSNPASYLTRDAKGTWTGRANDALRATEMILGAISAMLQRLKFLGIWPRDGQQERRPFQRLHLVFDRRSQHQHAAWPEIMGFPLSGEAYRPLQDLYRNCAISMMLFQPCGGLHGDQYDSEI